MPPTLEEDGREFHDDTIVVKSENYWSRQSSPARMSPEVDINSLLTQINNAPQHLESPEPAEQANMTSNPVSEGTFPPSDIRTPKYPVQRPRTSMNATQEEKLIMMPEKRPLPWRDGVDPGAENETGGESRRKQIRFGCLLATRGEIQAQPCASCANGRGKFRVCVALEGFFKGACASCQLSGRPNRCSIKKNDDDVASSPTTLHAGGEATRMQHQPTANDVPQAKRRKKDTVPEWESARPQWEQELGDSQARQVMSERGSQHWASVNSQVRPPNTNMIDGRNGARTLNSGTEPRHSMSTWAPVNQNATASTPQMYAGLDSGGGYRSERTRRESTMAMDDPSVALIDTLPKNKQRQVYGLVSGIQGGIDHLQRELDSLKKALGIDDGD